MSMDKTSSAPAAELSNGPPSELKKCVEAVDQFSKFFGWIGAPLPFICGLMIIYEITMRTVFDRPTTWAAELTGMMCATCYFLGGAWNVKKDAHVRVDIIYSRFSPRVRAGINCLNFLLFSLYMLAMLKFIWPYMIQSVYLNESWHSLWDPYLWPLKIIMLLGYFLIMLQGLANFCRDLYFLILGREL